MKSCFVTIDSLKIHYIDSGGEGELILCLHGNSSEARSFMPLINLFSAEYRFIAIDFPGHGRSDNANNMETYSFYGLSQVVIGFTKITGLKPKIIIGHSMGGHAVIQSLAEMDYLQKLILISSPPYSTHLVKAPFFNISAPIEFIFKEKLSTRELSDFANSFIFKSQSELHRFISNSIQSTHGMFRKYLGEKLEFNGFPDEVRILEQFAGLELLILGGACDEYINRDYYDEIVKAFKKKTFLNIIENTGHYPHYEDPVMCKNLISKFIKNKNID